VNLVALSLTSLTIPSPSQGVWHLGPLPIRAYALAIILGVVAAVWTGERRWVARGGTEGQIADIALWAVPAGLIGARAYHVATDHDLYFGPGRHPIEALEIWHGGLGIWGAIAGGLLGAWFYCWRHDILLRPLADALAPGLLLAQAIGRFGNYFNQELYGRPTTLPWGLEIDPAHWPAGRTFPTGTVFHPTFLYEALWNLGAAALLLVLDRFYRFRPPALFALYVALYTGFRFYLEQLRIDPSRELAGMRVNAWVSLVVFVVAVAFLVWWQFFRGGRRPWRRGVREHRPERQPTMAVPRGRVRPRR
jgi:prolipoprotein diacylglyceryl transferase